MPVRVRLSEGLGPTLKGRSTAEGAFSALCAALKLTAPPALAAALSERTVFLPSSSGRDAGTDGLFSDSRSSAAHATLRTRVVFAMLPNTTTATARLFAPQALKSAVSPGAWISMRNLSEAR